MPITRRFLSQNTGCCGFICSRTSRWRGARFPEWCKCFLSYFLFCWTLLWLFSVRKQIFPTVYIPVLFFQWNENDSFYMCEGIGNWWMTSHYASPSKGSHSLGPDCIWLSRMFIRIDKYQTDANWLCRRLGKSMKKSDSSHVIGVSGIVNCAICASPSNEVRILR